MSDQEPGTTDTALLQPQDAGTNTAGITARTVTTDTSSGLSGSYSSQDVNGILSGYAWNGTNITYSFPTDPSYYGASYSDQGALSGWQAFSSAQQAVVQYALGLISQYTNLTFTQITETSTTHAALRFSGSSSSAVATSYAYYPGPFDVNGDVWIGNIRNVTPTGGSYAFDSILHEIGHTVGLKHGQDSDPIFGVLPAAHNSTEYSIMDYYPYPGGQAVWSNYTGSGNLTYMVDDISALQYLYGANYNSNSGNTVYKWDPNTGTEYINGVAQSVTSSTNTIYETIWDGGGTDTYDLSNYTTSLIIDLRPGDWSTFSAAQLAHLDVTNPSIVAPGNIANANLYNGNTASLIENAIGGSGNDTIIGNDANNVITGGAGNDTIDGGAGTNTAIYNGTASQYQITKLNSTTWQIVDLRFGSPDGTDTLTNIQLLQFFDQTLGLGSANVINYPDTTISSSAIVLSAAAGSYNGTQLQVLTGSATQSGVISENGGSYAIEKTGAGILFLTATNTYSGATIVTAGILEIGSGGTAGRLGAGAVVDNAELTFNRSDAVTVANAISGSGHITFAGSGNTIITTNNSYSGGTTISQGTVTVGNSSTTGSLGTGAIVDNGELTFSVNSSTTIANAISGTGHVTFGSNSGVTITGNDSYSGGTAITTGAILVGNNGTTGWITGDVSTASGTGINFDRADNVTFNGHISGQGYLNQLGLGTLTLAGTNSYSAYTNIANGRIAISSPANLGSGYIKFDFGTLQFNAAMTLTQNVQSSVAATVDTNGNSVILSGVLSNPSGTYGGLTKLGAGDLILAGIDNYGGATSVNAGTLTVSGSIVASSVTVASGGTLAGAGTVGNTTVQSGGTLSPGSGVGTLHVSGNLILASGSIYAEDLSTASSDGVTVTGNVTLSGTLAENFAGGSYSATTYTLLTATGTISGSFSDTSVTNLPAGFYSAISYDSHHAYLTLAHVPNISIGNASVTEGGVLQFSVTLDQATARDVTLSYDTFAGTASMADNDYLGGPGTLTIAAGQTTGTINIQTVQDTKVEPDETMSVHLLSASLGNLTQPIGTGTIVNDDFVPNISIGNASVTEGGVLHFGVTLDRAASQDITMSYDTFAGTASMANNDYLGGTGTLTIAAGQTTGTINIQTVDNVKNVPSQTMTVHLLSTNLGNLTQPIGIGTINNDAVIPNISIGNTSVTEGGVLHFGVTLDQATTKAVTLNYDTFAGTASMADNDYLGGTGTLTIAAGQTTGTINIQTVQDTKVEPDETMTVHLLSTNLGNLTQPIGTGTIINNDAAPDFQVAGTGLQASDFSFAASPGSSATMLFGVHIPATTLASIS